jgi:surfeit locus 1 family protein
MLLLHALAFVAVVGAAWLGLWQFDAWQQNREDKAADLVNAPAIPLEEALGPDDPFPSKYVGQPVSFDGEWVGDRTFFVSDRNHGHWVVTPVSTENGSAMLVVRGWSERPDAPDVAGAATVTGWLQPGEASQGLDADPDDAVLPSLRIADALERMDQDLYGGYVIAESPREAGLTPVTPDQLPRPGTFTSIRNLLYAIEWWVFGGFAVFLWWRWCRDEIDRVRSGTSATEAEPSDQEPEVPSSA